MPRGKQQLGVYVIDADHQVHDIRDGTVLFKDECAVFFFFVRLQRFKRLLLGIVDALP
jgi:hypothetical protein